jgi:hypothetical protein
VEIRGRLLLTDLIRFQSFYSLRRGTMAVLVASVAISSAVMARYVAVRASQTTARPPLAAYSRGPLAQTFIAQGFSGSTSESSWNCAWSTLKFIGETRSLFLLYQLPYIAIIVPKRWFESAEQIETWRQIATAGIGSRGIEKPGLVGRWC